jgi:hypothetical protein
MFEFLPDLGLAFLGLAFFGFVLKDSFNWEVTVKPPTMYKSYLSTIFHFVSIALFVIAVSIVFIVLILAAPNQNNPFTQFLVGLLQIVQTFETLGGLQQGFTLSIKNGLVLAFFPAFFYVAIVSLTVMAGRNIRFLNPNWIKIRLNYETREYPKIIADDEIFFYFEQPNNSDLWEAIKKTDIQKMEIVKHRSKFIDELGGFWKKITELWKQKDYSEIFVICLRKFWIYLWFIFFILMVVFAAK